MATRATLYPLSHIRRPDPLDRGEGAFLIVGEDAPAHRILHDALIDLGFDIGEAVSGEDAIDLCRVVHYDAVLLDMKQRGQSGIETCAKLRQLLPLVTIFMLEANNDRDARVAALDAGADVYLPAPLHLREFSARLRDVLRRAYLGEIQAHQAITIGELSLNPLQRLLRKAGARIHLTPNQFDILHYLMTHAGMPVTHSRLMRIVWGDNCVSQMDRLRTLVCQLRKKLEVDPAVPRYVLTESRIGYRFTDPQDWADQGKPDADPGPIRGDERNNGGEKFEMGAPDISLQLPKPDSEADREFSP